MEKRSLRTKIEAGILIFFLVLFSIAGVVSLTRRFTPRQDTIETFIKNSNGKIWEATDDNIQTAIDDIGIVVPWETYGQPLGVVELPGNTTVDVSFEIDIKDHVILDLNGCELRYNANVHCFRLRRGSVVKNGVVNVSGVAGYDKAIIHVFSEGYTYNALPWRSHPPKAIDLTFNSASQRGTGIYLNISAEAISYSQICNLIFDNIKITGFEYGVYLHHLGSAANNYINGNRFTNIDAEDCKYPFTVFQDYDEVAGNMFRDINVNCTSITEYIFWGNGYYTYIDNINAHNWDNNSGTRTSYNFSVNGSHSSHQAGHGLWLNFCGGSNDIAINGYRKATPSNCWQIMDREKGIFYIGEVIEGL